MKTNKSASIESRLKNHRDLVLYIKDYTLYDPTKEDIKVENYETFVNEVEAKMTPYRQAVGDLSAAETNCLAAFAVLVKAATAVRSEIREVMPSGSGPDLQVSHYVKLITGQNISENSRNRRRVKASLKEGEKEPQYISVAMLDYKSRLGNFRSMTGLLKSYPFYTPSDRTITHEGLEETDRLADHALKTLIEKDSTVVTQRSNLSELFKSEEGLRGRARRAKLHVRRKYGMSSDEYRVLTNKVY